MTSAMTTDQSASERSPDGVQISIGLQRPRPLASLAWAAVEESDGPVIDNAISGERIVIRKSAAQTGGRVLSFDLYLPPGGHVPAGHIHPIQEERFAVVAGQMRFRLGRRTILARPGDTVRVPPGTAHWFGNTGNEVALIRVEVRPALRMEELLRRTGRLGAAGHLPGTRMPRLSDLALVLLEFQRELAVPNAPPFLVRAVMAPLAWVARRRLRAP